MNMTMYANFFYPTQKLNKLINEYTDPLLQCQTRIKFKSFTMKFKETY